jgi:hypothetical protein
MKYGSYYHDEIINYVRDYLNNRYGYSDSITNRKNYVNIIAHIMAAHKISYIKLDANWPKFYLSDIMPMVIMRLREWLQKSGIQQLNQHTKLLIEMMADRMLGDVIYDTYLKHLSGNG